MQLDTATVAVITSGIIAIISLTVPLLISHISDARQWKREHQANVGEQITESTTAVLDALSPYGTGNVIDAAGQGSVAVYSRLLSTYYVWEHIISISSDDRQIEEGTTEIRRMVEAGRGEIYSNVSEIANSILRLARIAIK